MRYNERDINSRNNDKKNCDFKAIIKTWYEVHSIFCVVTTPILDVLSNFEIQVSMKCKYR